MSKIDFKNYICRPFCKFFRDGQKENMACRGAEVVELLLKSGRLNVHSLPHKGKNKSLWKKKDSDLKDTVCHHCEFEIDGCDYQSKNPPPDAEPCGGYILTALLLKKSTITQEDLKNSKKLV